MKRIALIIIFALIIKTTNSQNQRILGRIIDGKTLSPFSGIEIGFNSNSKTSSLKNGFFELEIMERQINDTLRIHLLNYYELKVINLPKDSIIDLGTIPIYEYFPRWAKISEAYLRPN